MGDLYSLMVFWQRKTWPPITFKAFLCKQDNDKLYAGPNYKFSIFVRCYIAFPSSYPCGSVSEWVSYVFRLEIAIAVCIYQACKLVSFVFSFFYQSRESITKKKSRKAMEIFHTGVGQFIPLLLGVFFLIS